MKNTESFEILISHILEQMNESYYDSVRRVLVSPSIQGLIFYERYLKKHYGHIDFKSVNDFSKKVYRDINNNIEALRLVDDYDKYDLKELKRELRFCFRNIDKQNINMQLEKIALSKTIGNDNEDTQAPGL